MSYLTKAERVRLVRYAITDSIRQAEADTFNAARERDPERRRFWLDLARAEANALDRLTSRLRALVECRA